MLPCAPAYILWCGQQEALQCQDGDVLWCGQEEAVWCRVADFVLRGQQEALRCREDDAHLQEPGAGRRAKPAGTVPWETWQKACATSQLLCSCLDGNAWLLHHFLWNNSEKSLGITCRWSIWRKQLMQRMIFDAAVLHSESYHKKGHLKPSV